MKDVPHSVDQKKLTLEKTAIRTLGPRVRTGIQTGSFFKHDGP